MGSDPDVLFPFETLKSELKLCGNFAAAISPMLVQICSADPKDVVNLNELGDEENQEIDLIQGLSENAQALYEERINELLEDLAKFGYFHKLE